MKTTIKKDCFAKVNLSLDVLGRREDGYHNLEMIMQTVSLKDILTVSVDTDAGETVVTVECNNSSVPQNDDNLAAKSAKLFLEKAGQKAAVKIQIEKNIPMGAGLGGGSSDAAGVLTALNEIYEFPLKKEELVDVAAGIGSDVPFFIYGGTMLAEDTGTKLSPVLSVKEMTILIAKPMFPVSTPHVYKSLRLSHETVHPDTKNVIAALEIGDLKKLSENAGNVLETVTAAEHKEIDEYKNIMLQSGAAYALMSGSGPSVFGVFENEDEVLGAYKTLSNLTEEVYITKAV